MSCLSFQVAAAMLSPGLLRKCPASWGRPPRHALACRPPHGPGRTQLLPHVLQVVQIIRHGVGEVHEDVQVHGALQGLEHVQPEVLLLARPQPGPQALGGHLAASQGGVDLGLLCSGKGAAGLDGHSRGPTGSLSAQPGDTMDLHKQPALSMAGPPPLTPAPGTSVILKLPFMTTMLSCRQPAASSSITVLQRLSLNIWPEENRVRRQCPSPHCPNPGFIPPDFPDPPLLSDTCLAQGWAEGVASVDVARARAGAWQGGAPRLGPPRRQAGWQPLTSSVQ